MAGILTVTLNPALDVTTAVEKLTPRHKLRCEKPRYDPGGGGINVSRAIAELGGESRAFVALGGATGRHMEELLDERAIDREVWRCDGETRISLHVTERSSDEQYRFVLPGPEQPADAAADLLDAVTACLDGGDYGFIVGSGSLTPGLPDDFYARLATHAREFGACLLLDTSGAALEAALDARPYLVKPDRHEARGLAGKNGDEELSVEMAEELVRRMVEREIADIVVVTVGGAGTIVGSGDGVFRIRPPEVRVVSAVGAGDSFMAALALGLARDWSLEDACRFGVAAAASAVTTEATALCERARTEEFFDRLAGAIERLD